MATTEYYRKQVELLLLEFSTLVDCVDDGMLRTFQELFAEFNAQLLHKP
jgi:hypothetical protein